MKTVNIHEAKTHLSRLIAAAEAGDPFVIARSGKPVVKVEAIELVIPAAGRLDILKGRIDVPDDFDSMGRSDVDGKPDR